MKCLSLVKAAFVLASVALSFETLAACAPDTILRNDVLIIVNDNSKASPQVGDYYCEQRGINPSHVAHVRVPATRDMGRNQFFALRDQLIKFMQENTLVGGNKNLTCDTSKGYSPYYCPETTENVRKYSKIRYLVTTKGVPNQFSFTGSTLIRPDNTSVDNYLRFWLVNFISKDIAFNRLDRAIDFKDGRGMRLVNPEIDSELIIGRIDGITIEAAKNLVDRAIAAEIDGVYGKLYGSTFRREDKDAQWKQWFSRGSTQPIYVAAERDFTANYLHGLFGEFTSSNTQAIRHTENQLCIDFSPNDPRLIPRECVVQMPRGGGLSPGSLTTIRNDEAYGRQPNDALLFRPAASYCRSRGAREFSPHDGRARYLSRFTAECGSGDARRARDPGCGDGDHRAAHSGW